LFKFSIKMIGNSNMGRSQHTIPHFLSKLFYGTLVKC
jgi:hypothetical protein